jgi:enoyl-CoA hydratase
VRLAALHFAVGEITVETRAGVAWLTIDDPARRNALDLELARKLADGIAAADADAGVGALVIAGAGSAFCAGGDRATLVAAARAPMGERRQILEALYRPFLRLREARKPSIAVVHGAAVGAGLNLALAADVSLATFSARFRAGFLAIGIHPGGGHTAMVQARVGSQAAAAMLLFGETLDGAQAKSLGLVYECGDDVAIASLAQSLGERSAAFPREVTAAARATLLAAATAPFHEMLARELDAQAESLGRPEALALLHK